jgi:hypothetical protein
MFRVPNQGKSLALGHNPTRQRLFHHPLKNKPDIIHTRKIGNMTQSIQHMLN